MKRNYLFVAMAAIALVACDEELAGPEGSVQIDAQEIAWDGMETTLTIAANCDWQIKCDSKDVTFDPMQGNADVKTVNVNIAENTTNAELSIPFSVEFTGENGEVQEVQNSIIVPKPSLTYGGVTYAVTYLKDGNYWMAENLRFVPEGKTVSDDLSALDNGVWYPVKVNAAGDAGEFDKSEEGVAAKGYLYTTAVAFGVARDGITEDNAASFEACQGICPEGWRLPTVADQVNLVGKCNNASLTNAEAPYYDATLASPNGSITKLEADNWPVGTAIAGMVSVANPTATKGTIAGVTGTAPNKKLNTGYFAGSSFYKKTTNNIQFYGLMPNAGNSTIAAAYLNMTFGVSVRCVKVAKD